MLPLRNIAQRTRPYRAYLPPLNFITIHYIYIICTTLICSVIFYLTSSPAYSVRYVDCLFMQVSAITEAGLNTVNLSTLNTFQQCLLFLQIMAGSAIFVSISVLHVRKRAFESRFGDMLRAQREERRGRRPDSSYGLPHSRSQPQMVEPEGTSSFSDVEMLRGISRAPTIMRSDDLTAPKSSDARSSGRGTSGLGNAGSDHISFSPGPYSDSKIAQGASNYRKHHPRVFNFTGVGASPVEGTFHRPGPQSLRSRSRGGYEADPASTVGDNIQNNSLTRDVVGRNSQFHGLTLEERERLGGAEYCAILLLSWIVPLYFILWQLISTLSVGAWMAHHSRSITEANGINPWWNGAFNAVSAFNNSGMSLLDANMIPFQQATYPVITMGLLILAGNTAYPVFLRFIIWTMWRLLPITSRFADHRQTLRFILDHPRRVYTNLFPSWPTWWLVMTLVILNGTDWFVFEILNRRNDVVTSIPTGSRVLDGLFQALAVRSGGFYIVPISSLRIGTQVLYVVMMYISVYPIAITTRTSNVYEERSLGIYAQHAADKSDQDNGSSGAFHRFRKTVVGHLGLEPGSYFVRQQIRGQLAHDLSWLVVAIFAISCIEVSNFERDPVTYSVFNIMFEVVSGYGCVGISTGLPNADYSFSGGWHTASKLILTAVMLRGRHRGLPVALDRAVLLPGEALGAHEEEDHELRQGRSRDLLQED
ncbi:MAG: hypothetical protein M1818_007692 [Claussenomyces sp. TS43310]|nr:MAG: hypothetical protein M1818_007692 [Claussenomyces sp. TS43310]